MGLDSRAEEEVMPNNIGGLWINKNPNKKTAFYGNVKHTKIAVFPNINKKKDADPDYIILETRPIGDHEKAL